MDARAIENFHQFGKVATSGTRKGMTSKQQTEFINLLKHT